MKDINDLLSQFDDLQDLPISEEMLGAYLEGTLPEDELIQVDNGISLDDSLNELLFESSNLDMSDYENLPDNTPIFPEASDLFDVTEQNLFDDCFQTVADFLGIQDDMADSGHNIHPGDDMNASENGIHNDFNNF